MKLAKVGVSSLDKIGERRLYSKMHTLMKLLKLFIFVFIYLNLLPCLAAQSIDSLKLNLADAIADDTPLQLHLLRQISTFYQSVNMDSSQYYAEVLLLKAM